MPDLVTLRQPVTLAECLAVGVWRSAPDVTPMLRTGAKTPEEQTAFHRDVIGNSASGHQFYAVDVRGEFAGLGGLTYLDRVPGEAEITLILGPASRGRGLGTLAVDALLAEARRLGLTAVIGECYAVGNLAFWTRQVRRYPAHMTWRWTL